MTFLVFYANIMTMSEHKKDLTKNQKLIRRTALPLTMLAALGLLAKSYSAEGQASRPTTTSVLLGKVSLGAGVQLHSSPDQGYEQTPSGNEASGNVVSVVSSKVELTDPEIVYTSQLNGQPGDTWYGFTPKGQDAMVYFDGSAISGQVNSEGKPFITLDMEYGSNDIYQLDTPSVNQVGTAIQRNNEQFYIGKHQVAVQTGGQRI